MGRPRTINPTGEVARVNVRISQPTYEWLEQQARDYKITISEVIRHLIEGTKGKK